VPTEILHFWSHVFVGKTVAKNYLVNTLLTNNAISLAGIGITVIGLQASVGESLVCRCTAEALKFVKGL